VDAYCPHSPRGLCSSPAIEECGLRCVYPRLGNSTGNGRLHRYAIGTRGHDSAIEGQASRYPGRGQGRRGLAYMGPKELLPAEPDYEWTRAPATHRYVSKTFENCNYLQALEGGLDTVAFLVRAYTTSLGDRSNLRQHDRAPNIEVERTDYGYFLRLAAPMSMPAKYVRVYHYVMPAQQLRASVIGYEGVRNKPARLDGHIWVPIDDTHHAYLQHHVRATIRKTS